MTVEARALTNTPTAETYGGRAATMRRAWAIVTCRGDLAKTRPMASAPASAATHASCSLVMPQILMRTVWLRLRPVRRMSPSVT